MTVASTRDLVYYSDKTQTDKLYEVIEKADYLINVADLKPHLRAGISSYSKKPFWFTFQKRCRASPLFSCITR